jgi:hypothetical protein
MNGKSNLVSNAGSAKRRAATLARKFGALMLLAVVGTMGSIATHAQRRTIPGFNLTPPAALANCLPDASARVVVLPAEEFLGVDVLNLKAQGLPPDTEFTVFLTELPGPPFGAVEYIGDFTTNAAGKGSLRVNAIIDEAFASTLVGGTRVRKELNHVVIWFADPADDDFCFGAGGGVKTPFDADGEAGVTVLSSANALPGAPLP